MDKDMGVAEEIHIFWWLFNICRQIRTTIGILGPNHVDHTKSYPNFQGFGPTYPPHIMCVCLSSRGPERPIRELSLARDN